MGSQFVEPHCLFVLDHQTEDGSLDAGFLAQIPTGICEKEDLKKKVCASKASFVRCRIEHEFFCDELWRAKTIEDAVAKLLASCTIVIVGDTDELVIPVPMAGTLSDFLSNEPPFDLAKPLFTQRRFWYHNSMYSKPIVLSTPVQWNGDFHDLDGGPEPCTSLYLVHLHRIDRVQALERHRRYSAAGWNPEQHIAIGWQYRATPFESIDEVFKRFWSDIPPLEPIPEQWCETGI